MTDDRWQPIETAPPYPTQRTRQMDNRKAERQRDIVKALQDFQKWRDARHPDRSDIEGLAEEYAQDCASGAWPDNP